MNLLYKKRGLLMNSKSVPAGYTPIEYIESDYSQYIDTGVVPFFSQFRIVGKLNILAIKQPLANGVTYFFGAIQTYSNGFALSISDGDRRMSYVYGNDRILFKEYVTQEPVDFEFTSKFLKFGNLEINNTSKYTSLDTPLYIFGTSQNKILYSPYTSKMRLHNFKIYDGDTLLRDFQPVLNPDRKACLFDLVEQKPYYNPVGNDFIAGGIV
ncbi:MAG: hypothetical protein KH282_08180 [Clostridiales bacterium]|nr:hypothetical protein [Clostridiales bacterium]